jgi:peptidoglycan/LPS O-acetylase OafA/YrhL
MLSQTSDHLSHPKYRPDIDGLRGVAIILVVIYHAFPAALPGGFIGVDVFFVISGFLISAIVFDNLQRGSFSFFGFYGHRVRRIFPTLILVLAASLIAGWFLLVFNEYYRLTKHIAGGALFISNFLLWGESSYFDHAAYTKPLLHLWSLAVEEQFYLIWPPLLWATYRLKKTWLPVAMLVTVVSFLVNLWLVQRDSSGAFFLPQARIWEPLAGGLLAYFFLYRRNQTALSSAATSLDQMKPAGFSRWREASSLAGLAGIVACLFLVRDTTPYPFYWGLFPVLGAALVIAAGTKAWINRYVIGNPILVWVGLISYPLYLWHWPLLSFVRIIHGPSAAAWIICAAVAGAILLAWLTYRFVEKPIRRHEATPRRVVLLAALLLMVGCASFGLHRLHGVLERAIDPEAYALSHYDYYQGKTQEEFWKNSCFSLSDSSQFFRRNGCEKLAFPGHPKVMLVGDSHAAHISLGLRPYLTERKYNFILVSSAYCTPFSARDTRTRCQEIEQYAASLIARQKPDTLIMSANYSAYQNSVFNKEGGSFADFVRRRAREYTALGARRVILVGQIPVWDDDGLPKILLRRFVLKHRAIPDRTNEGLLAGSFDWDAQLRRPPLPPNVTYMSLKDLLCNPSGCMTRVGPNIQTDLLVKDSSHLTMASSAFVTRNLISKAIP